MAKLEGRARFLAGGAALALVIGGGWLGSGATSLVVLNDGMRIFYPWSRGLGTLLCAAGLVLLTIAVQKTWLSVIGLLLGAVAAGGAAYQWTYRVDADADAIAARSFFVRRAVSWREITHVGTDPTLVVLQGPGGRKVAIDTTDFLPSQRQRLSRTITRRINEASGSMAVAVRPSRPPTP